jgi:hypothetical protein
VDTNDAAMRVPAGAKVLGEWHTHPRTNGSQRLSLEDVRGANANRHIRCYRAFFSTPTGEVLTWDIRTDDVRAAMTSARRLANFLERHPAVAPYVMNSP